MKKYVFIFIGLLYFSAGKAQGFDVGVDFYNRYVFRGVDFGSSPSIQPTLAFSAGGFTIGAWGAFSTGTGIYDSFNEADLFASYDFDFGLSRLATSYYYPGSSWFELEDEISSHAIEVGAAYSVGGFSASAYYMLNDTRYGSGSQGGDTYFELGYSISNVDLFIGAGDGWHTVNNNFQVVNIGIAATKEISITEKFAIPVKVAFIVNPNTEQAHIVAGFSL